MAGVAFNLDNSNYAFTTEYNYTYYFSTAIRMRKFAEKRKAKQEYVAEQIKKIYHVYVDCSLISDIKLYNQLENRGCHIVTDKGEDIKWLDNVQLNGLTATLQDLKE